MVYLQEKGKKSHKLLEKLVKCQMYPLSKALSADIEKALVHALSPWCAYKKEGQHGGNRARVSEGRELLPLSIPAVLQVSAEEICSVTMSSITKKSRIMFAEDYGMSVLGWQNEKEKELWIATTAKSLP